MGSEIVQSIARKQIYSSLKKNKKKIKEAENAKNGEGGRHTYFEFQRLGLTQNVSKR